MTEPHRPLRLRIDSAALAANWRMLDRMSGDAACGAAVKANGYGIGAREAAMHLANAGCRDFLVSNWAEAAELTSWVGEGAISVLNGLFDEDLPLARTLAARPVLNTPLQVQRWREYGCGRSCDVMVDTGMNRLGLAATDLKDGILEGLVVETLMSHLACADEDVPANHGQRDLFASIAAEVPAKRYSLANSAGIFLGADYQFDLTRPGLALYGGIPRHEAEGKISQVVRIEAQIVQRRSVPAGGSVGYNATFTASQPCELAVLHIGYGDGYLRGFSGTGRALAGGTSLPVAGRVSMDLTAVRVDAAPELREGDWVDLDYHLPTASAQSGLSQYELLTTLGGRFERIWT